MRYLIISAAAAMALVGAATVGSAQDDKGKGPGEGKAPNAQATPDKQGPAQGDKGQPSPNRAEQPKAPKGAQREPDQQPHKGAQQRDQNKDQPKAAQQRQEPAKEQPKAAQQQRPEPGKDQPKAAEQKQQPAKDKQQSSQQRQEPGKDQPKAAEQKQPGKDQPKSAEQNDKQAGGRLQVTEQQRTGVRDRLVKETKVERVNRTNINVSINVGQALPRSVRLHAMPATIISLAPAYRGYSYVVLDDETICVVDARTYVIVDVIPAGTHRADRPGRAHLALSPDQTRFIFTRVPKDRTANVNVRLALGAEVPRDVELLAFPGEVTARIPEVGRYRYIVSNGDVIVVDPNDNGVVLVIND